ncbi:TolC family protein [Microbulbifer sp. SAOS-129_SWC]|uniref:TolC family protein n=1 Tax=Microbulbifer sp. SAOS-129_SWC TaxID=3145235 RepID=UPI00321660E8
MKQRFTATFLLLALLLALAGCASYTPEPLDPAAQQAALQQRRLDDPGLHRYIRGTDAGGETAAWPPASWDLPLLTLTALYYQPDIDRAGARRLAAEAAVISAGGRPNPTADVSSEHSANPPEDISPWTNGISLQLPIETAGKRPLRIDTAQARARAAQLREVDTLWQVRSRVRATLLASYPQETALQQQRDLQRQITAILQRRLDAGYASRPELTRAQLDLDSTTLSLGEARKARAENLAHLAAAVGLPAAALDDVQISYDSFARLPAPQTLPDAQARQLALLNRADVLAALADYEAAQSDLQLEIARQYPDLNIGPGYLWDQGERKWTLDLSLLAPLLNRNRGPIAEARAQRQVAAAAFLSAQAEAIAELDTALTGYRHAAQILRDAEALLQRQQHNEQATGTAFRAGEADRLDWLSARYETAAAEQARTRALIEANRSLGQLEDALRLPLGADASAALSTPYAK